MRNFDNDMTNYLERRYASCATKKARQSLYCRFLFALRATKKKLTLLKKKIISFFSIPDIMDSNFLAYQVTIIKKGVSPAQHWWAALKEKWKKEEKPQDVDPEIVKQTINKHTIHKH